MQDNNKQNNYVGKIAPTSLMVRATHDCNMGCSFCHIADEMKNKEKVDVSLVLDQAFQDMQGLPDYIAINGGEPLLDREMMGKLLSVILSAEDNGKTGDDIAIDIMTNGTLLDYSYAEIFNAYENISVCISITGVNEGEKSLKTLIKNARTAQVVQSIKSLKNKRIRYVVPNFKSDFELDVLSLMNIFDCNVEVSLDFESMPKLEVDDAYYLYKSIGRFDDLGILDRITFTSFFTSDCNCTESHVIKPNGTIQFKSNILGNDYPSSGCSYVSKILPEGMYELLTRIVEDARKLNTSKTV